jgi:glyoxylase-like metal-dependent hydrolase (beta-lactamase superfamily II)
VSTADPRPSTASALPGCAPIPGSAFGPAVNEQGYYVGRVEANLYWVTDGTYQSAFLTTSDGVVLFDAPPTIGHNIERAVDEIAAANGVSNEVTHLIYSHHHADHAGASSVFGRNITRIGHEETRKLLLRDDDPARPPPEETFQDRRTLEIGGERIELAWHGSNHSPDTIFIHLPDHDALMLVDIVSPGWAPVCQSNLTEDVPGFIEAPDTALTYPWKHFIGGHMGRLGPAPTSQRTGNTATAQMVRGEDGTMVSMQPRRLSEPADCQALIELALSTFGRIDVVFNLAAMQYFNWLEDITDEEWDRARPGRGALGVLPDPLGMATSEGQPRRGREHGVRERVAQLQDPSVAGPHGEQGGNHRHNATAGEGGPGARDSRQLDLTRPDRKQRHARAAQRPGVGELHARQDAVGSSRPAGGSRERRTVPGLGRELLRDRPRHRGRWRDEGLVTTPAATSPVRVRIREGT